MSYQGDQPPGPFLRRKLQDQAAHTVELLVLGLEGQQTRVDYWPASLGFDELIDEIEARASRHAAMGSSVCNFSVRVLDEHRECLGFDSFRVAATVAAGSRQMLSEPANEGGLVAQSMRHSEAAVSLLMRSTASNLEHSRRLLERSEEREARYEETHLRVMQLLEGARDKEAERELLRERQAANLRMKAEAFGKLKEIAPVVLDAIAGRTPQGAQHTAALLASEVFASVRTEQLQGLLALLDDEQKIKVLALYRRYAEQQEKAEGPNGAH